jgi:hypothetical protein
MSKALSLVVTLLALIAFGGLASAQTKDTTCTTPFTGGSGNFEFTYCVSPNGNIVQMETPAGFVHLVPGHLSEGYGLCDVTGGNTEYYDYGDGGVSSSHFWLDPVLISTSPLVIGRTTDDGIWQLKQTFTTNTADSSIKIKMELKNQTAVKREAKLVRYADVNINQGGLTDLFVATLFSASASDFFKTTPQSPGIELRDAAHGAATPYVQKVQFGPSPCTPDANAAKTKPFVAAPGSLELVYENAFVPRNGIKTATVLYRPF